MRIEGRLNIRLSRNKGTVNIESTRPVHASRVFHGKCVAESQQMIPLLFNICATAQSCAGIRACEQALGVSVTAQTEQRRDKLVNMETLREHLWRILLDWPALIGGEVDKLGMAEMVKIQRNYRQALCSDSNVFRLGGADGETDLDAVMNVLKQFVALLQRTVFAMPPGQWLTQAEQFTGWVAARQTIAAKLIDQIIQTGWSDAGACKSEALPSLTEETLHQTMQDADFIQQPQWSGHCCETTSLTRVDSPLLQVLKQKYGNGLLVRLVARLTEIAHLSGRLEPDFLSDKQRLETAPVNPGIGQAEAARGQLLHRVELNGDIIDNYQILAPSEWNFHPQGVVTQALSALKGDRDSVEKQARLLINAIDPCVGYELCIV